jgi:dTDP-4-amino-4,6-dideoxygalactose transaminase
MDEIMQWAADRGVVVLEDCCHAFGSLYKGRLCGTFGSAAFFSGQWNKPFSTGLGGMLLVNDEDLLQELNSIHRSADNVVFYENFRLKAQLLAYKSIVTPRTNALITGLYRFLSKKGIALGSSSPEELAGTMPRGYLKKMAPCQIAEGVVNLRCIDSNLAARRKNTALYDSGLKKIQFRHLELPGDTDCVVLRYPVRVGNKSEILKIAARKSLEIGSWFEVPLHPLGTDMASFGYNEGLCPESEKAAREVINLPTHAQITENEAQRIIGFLQEFALPA